MLPACSTRPAYATSVSASSVSSVTVARASRSNGIDASSTVSMRSATTCRPTNTMRAANVHANPSTTSPTMSTPSNATVPVSVSGPSTYSVNCTWNESPVE